MLFLTQPPIAQQYSSVTVFSFLLRQISCFATTASLVTLHCSYQPSTSLIQHASRHQIDIPPDALYALLPSSTFRSHWNKILIAQLKTIEPVSTVHTSARHTCTIHSIHAPSGECNWKKNVFSANPPDGATTIKMSEMAPIWPTVNHINPKI